MYMLAGVRLPAEGLQSEREIAPGCLRSLGSHIASASDSREVAGTPYCCYCGNGDDGSGGRRELLKLPLHSDSVHIAAMFIIHNF
jgi:hypothetical protein